jgi:hypothetical protein
MSPVHSRPSSDEVITSERLTELRDIIKHSDFTYIPKL